MKLPRARGVVGRRPHVQLRITTTPASAASTYAAMRSARRMSVLFERRHRQAGVAQLLPVELGRLALAAEDDRLPGFVDHVGDLQAPLDVDAGNVARQRACDVVERVVVV